MTGIRRRPVQQRSKEMVEYLLEAAARVFDREGIDATTNRIAEQAGVSIGSLYQYFGDKQGLLHELALRHLDEVEQTFNDAARTPGTSAYELAERFVHAAVNLHRQRGGLHRMMREHAPRSPELVDRFTEVTERIAGMIEKALTGSGTGDTATRARLIVSAVDAQVHTVLTEDVDEETLRRRTALVLEQVRTVIESGNDSSGSPAGRRTSTG